MKSPNKPLHRVTIREIAARAGVHFTTVSLALHNNAKLRPETRGKVQQIAREMGYQPDPMLAALNAYRLAKGPPHYQATIAWINNWPDRFELLRHEGFHEYYRGACERAQELGYAIEEFWLREKGMSQEKLRGILRARGIHGLLLPPQPYSNTQPPLDFTDYSAVTFGYSMQPSILHVVTTNHFHSINLMMDNLHALGYRRIGMFSSPDWDAKVGNAWLAGLLLAKRKHPELQLLSPLLNKRFAFNREELIATHRLDAVISYTSDLPPLRKLGYDIPGELGFASLDLTTSDTDVSGICENNLLIGKKAVDVLVGMIHRSERGVPDIPVTTLVEGKWHPGHTLRRLSPR